MIRRLVMATALVAGTACPALAEDPGPEPAPAGTAEGATRLRTALGAYLTDLPFETGILRVQPDPAGQRVTLDPASFLSDALGMPVRFAPISVLVSERTDGDWNVFSRDPAAVAFTVAGEGGPGVSFEYRQGAQVFKGVFSPALAAFRHSETTARDTVTLQSDPQSKSSVTVSETRLAIDARRAEAGGVDMDVRQVFDAYEQTVDVTTPAPSEGAAPGAPSEGDTAFPSTISFGVGAGAVETTATAKGARTVEMRDLYALAMRHVDALSADSKAALAGPLGEEFRAALQRLLPVWTSLEAGVTARDASFTSMFGSATAEEASETLRMTGVAADASFDLDMAVKGFKADSAFLPPWAADFMPQEIALGIAVSGVDLKTPADLALANLDFTKDAPLSPDVTARIAESFDPTRIKVALKPSRLRSAGLDLHLSGAFAFTGTEPSGRLEARAAGLDKAIAALQAAAQEMPDLHQTVGVLQMAKGFGRSTPDGAFEWIVEAAANGSVTVNGTMLKGPDPEPAIEEATPPSPQNP